MYLGSKVGDSKMDGTIFERDTRFCGVPKHWAKSWDLEIRSKVLEHKCSSVSLVSSLKILDIFVWMAKIGELVLVGLTPK